MSPFAEKARTLLGYKRLAWTSVLIPSVMPKPDVIALTGGYRRTPILQLGADVYCDTALIADVLERLAPEPSLYPASARGLDRIVAQWADQTLFWTAIPYALQPAGVPHIMRGQSEADLKSFQEDRAAFRNNVPRMRLPEATVNLGLYLDQLEARLAAGQAGLCGPDLSIADFAVYHCLWFVTCAGPEVARVLARVPRLSAWLERMRALGHGEHDDLDSVAAVERARSATPAPTDPAAFIDTHGLPYGSEVTVAATDYGVDPVRGQWVVSTAREIAIRRHDERAGDVVVHFPRVGFEVRKA